MKYVYLMRTGTNHYKVGVATNVFNRLKALQTSSSTKIELITAKRVENAFELEKSIHHSYASNKADGGKEWFTLTEKEVIDIAVHINSHSSLDLTEIDSLKDQLREQSDSLRNLVEQHIDTLEEALIKHAFTTRSIINKLESMSTEYRHSSEKNNDNKKSTLRKLVEPDKPSPPASIYDPLLESAINQILKDGKASTSLLQRKLSIGYGRAARIIEKLEERGVLSELDGIKPRVVDEQMASIFLTEIQSSGTMRGKNS